MSFSVIATKQKLAGEDFWYRSNTFPVTVPPLQHREMDIPESTEANHGTVEKNIVYTVRESMRP